MSRFLVWLDTQLLHPSLRERDGDTLRRARLLVLIALLLLSVNVVFDALYLLQGGPEAASSLLIGASYLAALIAVRSRGSLVAATHLLCGPLISYILTYAATQGAMTQVGTWTWSIFGITVTFLLGGARVGRFWAAAHLFAVGVAVATMASGEPPSPEEVVGAISVVTLSVLFVGIAVLYDYLKDKMVASVHEASERSRLVLDNIGDGFLLVQPDGTLTAERSRAAEGWFGAPAPDAKVWDYLFAHEDERLGMRLAWSEAVEDVLPRALLVEQLPKRAARDDRTWSLEYCIVGGAVIEAIVVVVRDITAVLAAERAQADQAEQAGLFQIIAREPDGFRAYLREAHQLIAGLPAASESARLRILHTLKGSSAQVGARSVAAACHQLEDDIGAGVEVGPERWGELPRRLEAITQRFAALLSDDRELLQIDQGDIALLRETIRAGRGPGAIEAVIDGWTGESLQQRFHRVAEQARTLAERLGRGGLRTVVDVPAVRYPRGRLDPLFGALAHVVRNAIDHGIEDVDARVAVGKPPLGTLRFEGTVVAQRLVLTISDDGRGIDWDRVRDRAGAAGLPTNTEDELVNALFADGVTTREQVSEVSGRGIGMSAIRHAVYELGGHLAIQSERGAGTTVTIALPHTAVTGTPSPRSSGRTRPPADLRSTPPPA